MHAIGGKETVVDALPEAVLIQGIAEVKIGIPVVITQRRGSHAKLIGGLEIFKDSAPGAVIARATPMTLIHNYQIEKFGRVGFEQAGASFIFRERLVNGEVHFPTFNDFARFNLVAGVAKRGEDAILGLVD